MKQVALVGKITGHEHRYVDRMIEVVAPDGDSHIARGRYLLPAGLKDPRGVTSYELERMLRSVADLRGERWTK